jgi:hypothetical protein
MRWLMLGLTLFGFALSFVTKSPAVLGLGIVLGFVGLFGLIFSMAADRVSASARPESAMLGAEDLAAMRARRTAASAPTATRTSAPTDSQKTG